MTIFTDQVNIETELDEDEGTTSIDEYIREYSKTSEKTLDHSAA